MTYNWDLIERLLHDVQNNGTASTSTEFETLLNRSYIEPRPREEGGDGSTYMLTKRGASLLALIDSSIPGNDHPRQVLNEQVGDPLTPRSSTPSPKSPRSPETADPAHADSGQDAERPERHTHPEHGCDSCGERAIGLLLRLQAIEVGEVFAHVGDAAQQFGALFRGAQGGDVDDQRYRGLLGLVVGLAVFRGPERFAVLQ